MINNPTVGADPELFLFDEDEGIYVPVIGFLGGTKANPKPVSDSGHYVQEDNVMAEFNIPPCRNAGDFANNIFFTMGKIADIIPDTLKLKAVPTAEFQEDFLDDPQACISGCDPYQNAWKGGKIEEAVDLETTNKRYAGAHIHIGYDDPNESLSSKLIRNLDLFLGIPSVIIDDDTDRRNTYGKAGAYRIKDYGVEYRSLSNFWLKNDKLTKWVFKNTMQAISYTNQGKEAPEGIDQIINSSNKTKAANIITDLNIPMP